MLRFLHIPKTAGTSFKRYLQEAFPGEQYIEFAGHQEQDQWIYDDIGSGRLLPRLVGGHAALETGIASVDSMPTMTLLRDPVERVLSFCRHVAEGKTPILRERFSGERFNLDEFLHSGYFELSNLQTAMLSPGWSYHEKASYDRDNESAIELIAQRPDFFVGIVELLPESMFLMHRQFMTSLSPLETRNRSAVNLDYEQLDASMEKIVYLNRLDIQLYILARKHILNQIEGLSLKERSELERYKLACKRFAKGKEMGMERRVCVREYIRRRLGQFMGRK